VLPGPFGGRIAQSGNSDAAWQPALDGGRNQVGSKEGERYGHVDLPHAVSLLLRDALHICFCASEKFVKPSAAARD